ncbi:pyridine nucleotide-disulfide oxidoreductase domain-containing protein 1-like [Diadema antillarum]|uniref:pyridine nucleotide-disulfide oxidoreductase domain-containing protein 1-like n=1 Tax=Diadema antillarum TaxID=105358 RepID=UPI003A86411B
MASVDSEHDIVIIGGGIAGVSCVEQLAYSCPERKVKLFTASPVVKAVTNYKKMSRALEEFDVEEKSSQWLEQTHPNVEVIHAKVTDLHPDQHLVKTKDGRSFPYAKVCLCTGGRPKKIAEDNPYILGIRDTESVQTFQEHLEGAKRIVVVGNGGIATELVYEVEGCEVIWAIKDASISSTFVDAGTAEFFLPHVAADKEQSNTGPSKRLKYTLTKSTESDDKQRERSSLGSALGPDWSAGLDMKGQGSQSHMVHIEYQCEVDRILSPEDFQKLSVEETVPTFGDKASECAPSWRIYIKLTNGKIYGCDFIVSATGVLPNTTILGSIGGLKLSEDGGVAVDDHMRTSIGDVYAAGDVCTATWEPAPNWTQMRLWSQARQMGAYAAKCMVADECSETIPQDFCFELFAHVTRFFGFKVVLLGKFNGQGLGTDYEVMLRMTKGVEYVKVVMHNGLMKGAILIGDTDLEETFENLILNETDLSPFGVDLLDPNIDIEDYFD